MVLHLTISLKLFAVVLFITLGVSYAGRGVNKYGHQKNLSCYICQTTTQDSFCQEVDNKTTVPTVPSKQCDNDHSYCRVRRYSFTNNGTNFKVWALQRDCAKHCESNCVIIGERSKLQLCTSCCQDELCNLVSKATNNNVLLLISTWTTIVACINHFTN